MSEQRQLSTYELALALARAARMGDALDMAERRAYAGDGSLAKGALLLARLWIQQAQRG